MVTTVAGAKAPSGSLSLPRTLIVAAAPLPTLTLSLFATGGWLLPPPKYLVWRYCWTCCCSAVLSARSYTNTSATCMSMYGLLSISAPSTIRFDAVAYVCVRVSIRLPFW